MPLVAFSVEDLDYMADNLETAARLVAAHDGLPVAERATRLVAYMRGHAEMARKPLVVARADLVGKTSRTVSVAVFDDGDFGLSQGRDMVLMDSDQQGQVLAFMRKHLPHLFPSAPKKET